MGRKGQSRRTGSVRISTRAFAGHQNRYPAASLSCKQRHQESCLRPHYTAELRGLYGTGHGRDGKYRGLEPRHARLVVGAAVAFIDFVTETFEKRERREAHRPVEVGHLHMRSRRSVITTHTDNKKAPGLNPSASASQITAISSPTANATTVTPPAAATIAVTVAVTTTIAATIVATAIKTTTIVCLLSNTRLFSFECLDTTGQRGCTCAWT